MSMHNEMASDATPIAAEAETYAPIKIKRRLNINITGTLANFGLHGPGAATWKPVEGKHVEVFGAHDHEGLCLDHASMTNALRNAIVLKATILEHKSTFPVPLGLSVSCLTPEEVTDTGEKYVATVMPNSINTNPLVVYEADKTSNESIEWRNRYPSYNASNLETWGVLDVQKCPYVFVHMEHPVVELLRANKEMLGADIDLQDKIDKQWYKVTRQVMSSCCNTLRTRILSRVTSRDLNAFSVQLHRLGDVEWGELGLGEEAMANFRADPEWDEARTAAAEKKHLNSFLRNPCTYIARMELEYEIQP
jgi:hypothetical protein